MSILPIQTKFTGISRPQKVSFVTFNTDIIPGFQIGEGIIPGYFESGTVILGATINRTDGEPFPDNSIFTLSALDEGTKFYNLLELSIKEGQLIQYNDAIGISFPFPFFLILFAIPGALNNVNYRITVEYSSDSGPSLN